MTQTALASKPRSPRPFFDFLFVRWRDTRSTVVHLHEDGRIYLIKQGDVTLSASRMRSLYYLKLETPDGPSFVEVSKRRWDLTKIGDPIPLQYRIGRRSGKIQARFID